MRGREDDRLARGEVVRGDERGGGVEQRLRVGEREAGRDGGELVGQPAVRGGVVARAGDREHDQRPAQRRVVGLGRARARSARGPAAHRFSTVAGWSAYSHSIVPGGFDVMSRTTRLTSRISLIIREAICSSRSYGRRAQSAVIASSEVTARIATT